MDHAAAQLHHVVRLRSARPKRCRRYALEPLARIALDCGEKAPLGLSRSQRWRVRVSEVVACRAAPARVAASCAAAMRHRGWSRRRAGSNGQAWERVAGTTCAVCVAGRGCKAGTTRLAPGISGAPIGWVLVACLSCQPPPAAGSLGNHGPPGLTLALHHLRMRRHRLMRPHLQPWNAPGKLREIKHLRINRGPAHYRGQRPVGCVAHGKRSCSRRDAERDKPHVGRTASAAPSGG